MAELQEYPEESTIESRVGKLEGSIAEILELLKYMKNASPTVIAPNGSHDSATTSQAIPQRPQTHAPPSIPIQTTTFNSIPTTLPAQNIIPSTVYVNVSDSEALGEKEKEAAKTTREHSKMSDKVEILEEKIRAIQGIDVFGGLDVDDLCLFPDVVIPPKFKMPDFDKYDGNTCPKMHLTIYIRNMAAYMHNEKLMIHCFQHSLSGAALHWFLQLDKNQVKSWRSLAEAFLNHYRFNTEIAPDRFELQRMEKKDSEAFKEYAQRWRKVASQVQPPLTDRELITTFVNTLKVPFFDKMIGSITSRFSDIVLIGGQVEDAIRSGKLHVESSKGDSVKKSFQPRKDKTEGEIHMMNQKSYTQYQPHPSSIRYVNATGSGSNTGPTSPLGNPSFLDSKNKRKEVDPIPMTYNELFAHLRTNGLAVPEPPAPVPNPPPKWYKQEETCAFHMGAPGHSIENCFQLKYKVQRLREAGLLEFNEYDNKPNISSNPLPDHQK